MIKNRFFILFLLSSTTITQHANAHVMFCEDAHGRQKWIINPKDNKKLNQYHQFKLEKKKITFTNETDSYKKSFYFYTEYNNEFKNLKEICDNFIKKCTNKNSNDPKYLLAKSSTASNALALSCSAATSLVAVPAFATASALSLMTDGDACYVRKDSIFPDLGLHSFGGSWSQGKPVVIESLDKKNHYICPNKAFPEGWDMKSPIDMSIYNHKGEFIKKININKDQIRIKNTEKNPTKNHNLNQKIEKTDKQEHQLSEQPVPNAENLQ